MAVDIFDAFDKLFSPQKEILMENKALEALAVAAREARSKVTSQQITTADIARREKRHRDELAVIVSERDGSLGIEAKHGKIVLECREAFLKLGGSEEDFRKYSNTY